MRFPYTMLTLHVAEGEGRKEVSELKKQMMVAERKGKEIKAFCRGKREVSETNAGC